MASVTEDHNQVFKAKQEIQRTFYSPNKKQG